MKTRRCDVAVIGAGTAGLAARAAAAHAGAEVVVIEAADASTTCARAGCMPSKLLIAAASVAHSAATASVFGIQTAPVRIDGRAVLARVRRERDRFVRSVLKSYESIPAAQRLHGHAAFVAPGVLDVDGCRVEARAIVIATGSRADVPKAFEAVRERVLTNENLFELEDLPSSVAVIGAGPLGMEMAQALHRLGVRVTVFDRKDAIGGLRGAAMNQAARQVFQGSPTLRLGVEIQVEAAAEGVRVQWRGANGDGSSSFSHVLVAAGRPPNLDRLGLEHSGLELDDHGTPRFDPRTLQCASKAVFIAGDADHDRPVLHEASDEGSIAGRNAAGFPAVQRFERSVPMSVVFTEPQIAVIGEVEREGAVTGTVDFSDQGRARVMNRNAGCLRVYADAASGVLIGAEMLAPAAEHLAHLVAWAVQQKLPARALLDLPFYHPTFEEGLRTALRDLCSRLDVPPANQVSAADYGPGA